MPDSQKFLLFGGCSDDKRPRRDPNRSFLTPTPASVSQSVAGGRSPLDREAGAGPSRTPRSLAPPSGSRFLRGPRDAPAEAQREASRLPSPSPRRSRTRQEGPHMEDFSLPLPGSDAPRTSACRGAPCLVLALTPRRPAPEPPDSAGFASLPTCCPWNLSTGCPQGPPGALPVSPQRTPAATQCRDGETEAPTLPKSPPSLATSLGAREPGLLSGERPGGSRDLDSGPAGAEGRGVWPGRGPIGRLPGAEEG